MRDVDDESTNSAGLDFLPVGECYDWHDGAHGCTVQGSEFISCILILRCLHLDYSVSTMDRYARNAVEYNAE